MIPDSNPSVSHASMWIMRLPCIFVLAAANALAALPVSFEPNRGQAPDGVLFLAHSRAGALLLESRGAVLRTAGGSEVGIFPEAPSCAPQVQAEEPTGARGNYLLGSDPGRWIRRVPQFGRVRYRGLYPGIDLVFHGASAALEYDLEIAPGADPQRVRLRYQGARRLSLDPEGNLIILTATGSLEQKRPVVYQELAGGRRAVAGRFVLRGPVVAFRVGPYDRTRPLVIDPVLVYGTYLGGLSRDLGNAVAVDAGGNAYLTGSTVSADFPVTANALQVKHGGTPDTGFSGIGAGSIFDAFVAKFSPDGSKLLYATFLGGAGSDQGLAIAVDRSGNAVVAGSTTSQNFPLAAGAIQKAPPPYGTAGFVAKLNADGSDLLYSTYLGGAGGDTAVQALAMDAAGAVYLAGVTNAAPFPVTPGAFQATPAGATDCFVAKVNPQGTALVYATLLGGAADDSASGIAVTATGSVYVTGQTVSTDFPVTSGAAQAKNAGSADAFIAALNPAGTALLYATYLGGSSYDAANAIALDSDGSVLIAGLTFSQDFPATLGAFQTALAGGSSAPSDAFVARFNPSGAVQFATLLGGAGSDSAKALAVAADGSATVAGQTASLDFPLTPDAYESELVGAGCVVNYAIIPVTGNFPSCWKLFLTTVHVSGRRLVYSTYLGGSDNDTPGGLAFAADGKLFITGSTGSADFPVTTGAYQTQKKVNTCTEQFSPSASMSFACEDAFLLKIDPAAAGPPRPVAAVANATNGVRGPIAPGEIVSLFGPGIGPAASAGAQLDSNGFVARTLAGTTVLFNGLPAPLLYVSANQINAIVPFGVAGSSPATIVIDTPAYSANVAQVAVTDAAPGLVSISGTGQNQAAALNQDGTLNSPANPAARGSVIVLYGTGVGQTSPPGTDGHLADNPAPLPLSTVFAIIGGVGAQVLYAGGAPGLVEGAVQINAVIPGSIAPGSEVPVMIAAGSGHSQPLLTIAVK
jgi:uncharacterized protein (TIGR03437 family)